MIKLILIILFVTLAAKSSNYYSSFATKTELKVYSPANDANSLVGLCAEQCDLNKYWKVEISPLNQNKVFKGKKLKLVSHIKNGNA